MAGQGPSNHKMQCGQFAARFLNLYDEKFFELRNPLSTARNISAASAPATQAPGSAFHNDMVEFEFSEPADAVDVEPVSAS